MAQIKHTQTPWEIREGTERQMQTRDGHVATFAKTEDAQFALHACNSHDDLAAALRSIPRTYETEYAGRMETYCRACGAWLGRDNDATEHYADCAWSMPAVRKALAESE